MARIKGRGTRTDAQVSATIYVRVSPDNRAKVETAARTLGISLAAYVDALLEHEKLDDDGRPTWWATPASGSHDQEELPLPRSA